jgi:hypothetical protein
MSARQVGILTGLVLTFIAARTAAVTLVIASTTVGGTVVPAIVPVSVVDATGVEAIDLELSYDPAVLDFYGVAQAGLASGCMIMSHGTSASTLAVSIACVAGLDGSGNLFTVALRGKSLVSSQLRATRCSINEGALPCQVTPGTIAVVTPTPTPVATPTRLQMDVSGNGDVSSFDAAKILQCVVRLGPCW